MIRVDVATCTFRRTDLLVQCLRSIACQTLPPGHAMRVIVADNNLAPIAREDVARIAAELNIEAAYVHAPAANISIARNACLDAARGDWLVFIDDDEVAQPDWLARLLAPTPHDADIVFGVSVPMMPHSAPRWSRSGTFHANRLSGNDQLHNGYTCNVAMRRKSLGVLRFSVPLGTTGGEDTMFFHQALRQGLRFGYHPDAIVREHIPAARATLSWLMRRRFRSGQIHHMLLREGGPGHTVRGAALALVKVGWCMAMTAANLASSRRAVHHLSRGVFHMGVIAAALGRSPLQEYAAAGSPGSYATAMKA